MAISCSSTTSGSDNTGRSTYTTASITPTSNTLQLIAVRSRKGTGSGASTVPTVSGCSLTWVQVATQSYGAKIATGYGQRLTVFRAMGASPSTGTLSIDFAGDTQTECSWTVTEVSGIATTGSNGSDAVTNVSQANQGGAPTTTGSPSTLTMGTFSSSSDKTWGASATTGATQSAGTSMTRLNFSNGSGGAIADEWSNTNNNVSPVTMTWAGTLYWAVIGVELVGASSGVNGTATPSGVSATSTENNSLGEPKAAPSGTAASSSKNNPTASGAGIASPSGISATSAKNNPVGNPSALPSGTSASSTENDPSASGAGIGLPDGIVVVSAENNPVAQPVALVTGVAAIAAENDPTAVASGAGTALPSGVSATSANNNPTALGEGIAASSGVSATSAENNPSGLAAAVPSGVSLIAAENNPTATASAGTSGHAFDHNCFDFNAFDTDGVAVSQFGGVPRPFFSYSGKRLVWSQPKQIPVEPLRITGTANLIQSPQIVMASGRLRFPGTGSFQQKAQQLVVNGTYTPLRIRGIARVEQFPATVIASGEMFDTELLEACIALVA